MKKLVCTFALCLLLVTAVIPFTASAAGSGTVTLSGPGTVYAGDTITVTLGLQSSNINAGGAEVIYDPSQLTLQSAAAATDIGWSISFNNSTGKVSFGGYNTSLNAWSGSKTMVTMKFKVASLAVGTAVTVQTANVQMSDGSADGTLANATYSKTISAPPSGNANLASLTVSNATISPAFNKGTTSYTADVPFDITKLEVNAVAEDSKASVSVNSPTLKENATTAVTVTVTSETGVKKVYTINVKRARDPNYVESTNNSLKSLSIAGVTLTPAFSKDITAYTAEVPFSISTLNITAVPEDGKASFKIENNTLKEDAVTDVRIVVTAENGGAKTYTVSVKRGKYITSADSSLSGITVEGFLLSPVFSPDLTEYVVWLPNETESVKVAAKAANDKSSVEIIGGEALEAGQDNVIKITCTAENGEKKEYTVIAKRAAVHSSSQSASDEPGANAPVKAQPFGGGMPMWLSILLIVIGIGAGFGGGFAIKGKVKE